MNFFGRSSRSLAVLVAAGVAFGSVLPMGAADKDRDECARNLQAIWNGIQKYREQHRKLPLHLSELVPDFVSTPNLLICPVTKRTGEIKNQGFSDPKLTTSYVYEFSNHPVPGAGLSREFTLRDWRELQMGKVGSIVPVLRCFHHPRVLNMSFDGKVYETAGNWEAELSNIVDPDSLSPTSLLAEIEYFATGIRAARIKTIDLTKYYNVTLTQALHDRNPEGPSLKNLPKGRNKFGGIPFEVSGAIHLYGTGLANIFPDNYPTNVTDIAIGELAEKVHFLVGAGYNQQPGQRVGSFKINYEDDQSTEVMLIYDQNVRDWWQPFPGGNTTLHIAWSGLIGPNLQNQPQNGLIYQFSWDNPRAQTPIKSIDFSSALNTTAPFLLGVSVETP